MPATLRLPDAPVVVVHVLSSVWLSSDGEIESLSLTETARRVVERDGRVILCHAPASFRRLRVTPMRCFDVLELFAFVYPARFCLPTPAGLAQALGLAAPQNMEGEAETLFLCVQKLLSDLRDAGQDAAPLAWSMMRGGWPWGGSVLAGLGEQGDGPHSQALVRALQVWHGLKEWADFAPPNTPGHLPVEPVEARAKLVQVLGETSEERPQQKSYAEAACEAFAAVEMEGHPRVALNEAGTGIGKTLGYVAPAAVWADKNAAPVWISTYTRNLQRQLDGELDRVFPNPKDKRRKVVIRKGRENYFCLLNFEEAVQRLQTRPEDAPAIGLMARWARATRDGDMIGGDFPSWLRELLGMRLTLDLTDTRGECIYSACSHYSKCFIEKTVRRARRADIVVANHALVMAQTAMGGLEEGAAPYRLVFDEGHHVFDAADKAFAAHLTGREGEDLRRWLLGSEGTGRSRARGLKERVGDLLAGHEAGEALSAVLGGARILPGPAWHQRLAGGSPNGPAEKFLTFVRQQVYARDANQNAPYSLETGVSHAVEGLVPAAIELAQALEKLRDPLQRLIKGMMGLLDEEAEDMDTATRQRIESLCASLENRALSQVRAWHEMLESLLEPAPEAFVDWFSVDRDGGRDVDVGMHRHWVDPAVPFATAVLQQTHGALITSATLRDGSGDEDQDWKVAQARTGTAFLSKPAVLTSLPSPFNYAENTKVIVVTDVNKNNADQVSAAYRELFLASGGGALGLFTAIHRLRAVYQRIVEPIERTGLPLYAQHIDAMDTGTLIDIFKAERNSCLLGTDAIRDGVDVPGDALRLIVFDRVPWPRPSILHQARKRAFPGKDYNDMLTRLKLKQAFGRLIRRADDRGVFVILDKAMPSRLLGAFPQGTVVERIGLADALKQINEFFGHSHM